MSVGLLARRTPALRMHAQRWCVIPARLHAATAALACRQAGWLRTPQRCGAATASPCACCVAFFCDSRLRREPFLRLSALRACPLGLRRLSGDVCLVAEMLRLARASRPPLACRGEGGGCKRLLPVEQRFSKFLCLAPRIRHRSASVICSRFEPKSLSGPIDAEYSLPPACTSPGELSTMPEGQLRDACHAPLASSSSQPSHEQTEDGPPRSLRIERIGHCNSHGGIARPVLPASMPGVASSPSRAGVARLGRLPPSCASSPMRPPGRRGPRWPGGSLPNSPARSTGAVSPARRGGTSPVTRRSARVSSLVLGGKASLARSGAPGSVSTASFDQAASAAMLLTGGTEDRSTPGTPLSRSRGGFYPAADRSRSLGGESPKRATPAFLDGPDLAPLAGTRSSEPESPGAKHRRAGKRVGSLSRLVGNSDAGARPDSLKASAAVYQLVRAFEAAKLRRRPVEEVWASVHALLAEPGTPSELFDELIVIIALEMQEHTMDAFMNSPFFEELWLINLALQFRSAAVADGASSAFRPDLTEEAAAGDALALSRSRLPVGALPLVDGSLESGNFNWLGRVGRGGYGAVFAASHNVTGAIYAIKRMNKRVIKQRRAERLVLEERAVLQHAKSRFVTDLKFAFQNESEVCLGLELVSGGDVDQLLARRGRLSEPAAKLLAVEMVVGLRDLHLRGIMHRDLKPANILLTPDGHVKLADLGLACFVTNGTMEAAIRSAEARMPASASMSGRLVVDGVVFERLKHGFVRVADHYTARPYTRGRAGTPGYWAPEMLVREPLTGKAGRYDACADWWSFGCTLFALLTGRSPFHVRHGDTNDDNFATLHGDVELPTDDLSPELAHLLSRLLERDTSRRLGAGGAREVMAHPWFRDVSWPAVGAGRAHAHEWAKRAQGDSKPVASGSQELPKNQGSSLPSIPGATGPGGEADQEGILPCRPAAACETESAVEIPRVARVARPRLPLPAVEARTCAARPIPSLQRHMTPISEVTPGFRVRLQQDEHPKDVKRVNDARAMVLTAADDAMYAGFAFERPGLFANDVVCNFGLVAFRESVNVAKAVRDGLTGHAPLGYQGLEALRASLAGADDDVASAESVAGPGYGATLFGMGEFWATAPAASRRSPVLPACQASSNARAPVPAFPPSSPPPAFDKASRVSPMSRAWGASPKASPRQPGVAGPVPFTPVAVRSLAQRMECSPSLSVDTEPGATARRGAASPAWEREAEVGLALTRLAALCNSESVARSGAALHFPPAATIEAGIEWDSQCDVLTAAGASEVLRAATECCECSTFLHRSCGTVAALMDLQGLTQLSARFHAIARARGGSGDSNAAPAECAVM